MEKINYYISDISDGNLALHVTNDFDAVNTNRKQLSKKIGVKLENFIFLNQIHGDNIINVDGNNRKDLYDGDAIITKEKNTIIGVLIADCVPILLYDKKKFLIGAVHAGWKGTNKKIIKKTINKLIEEGANINDIEIIIGPSISKESYEVGNDVADFFRDEVKEKLFSGKYLLDLRKENLFQIFEMGIQKEKVKNIDIDTFNNKKYFSARQKNPVGRFGAFIWIKQYYEIE